MGNIQVGIGLCEPYLGLYSDGIRLVTNDARNRARSMMQRGFALVGTDCFYVEMRANRFVIYSHANDKRINRVS